MGLVCLSLVKWSALPSQYQRDNKRRQTKRREHENKSNREEESEREREKRTVTAKK